MEAEGIRDWHHIDRVRAVPPACGSHSIRGKVSNADEDAFTVIALDQFPLAQFPLGAG